MTTLEDWLAERKQVHAEATEGPWEADGTEISQHWSRPEPWREVASNEVACMAYCYGGSARGVERADDAEAIVDAHNHAPTLHRMIEVVLELHERLTDFWDSDTCEDTTDAYCDRCRDEGGDRVQWPCDTVRAMEAVIWDA